MIKYAGRQIFFTVKFHKQKEKMKTGINCELLTVNEGAIEPLNVVVLGEGEQDLITND